MYREHENNFPTKTHQQRTYLKCIETFSHSKEVVVPYYSHVSFDSIQRKPCSFVRSFQFALDFYMWSHTEKNLVATWWAIGISLSTPMCCNGNTSVRLCSTSSDRCAHFVAVLVHITYSKIHRFPNNHHIYWVCCVFFSPLVKNLDMFIFIHELFVRTRNSDNEITMFFFLRNCSKQPAHTVIQFHSDISIKFR